MTSDMKHSSLIIYGLIATTMFFCSCNNKKAEISPELTEAVQKYERLYPFKNGLAKVAKNGTFGYIDYKGNEVIPCKYNEAEDFSQDLVRVVIGDRCGYIDKKGNEAVPCKYSSIENFSEGLAVVKRYQDGTYLYGYVDKKGNEVIPCKYDWALSFTEGLAAIKGENGLHGYINTKGEEVIPCMYRWVSSFSEGLAAVQNEEGLYGYIDANGKQVVAFKYHYANGFSEGFALVRNEKNLCGYINTQGEEVIPCRYYSAESFSKGLAKVKIDYNNYGMINAQGEEVIPCQYDIINDLSEGLVCVGDENGVGFIDVNGNIIIPCQFERSFVSNFSGGLAAVSKNNKIGFIDKKGNEKIPFEYSLNCRPEYYDDIIVVCQYGFYGAIDKNGNEILPFIYDSLWGYSEGLFVAVVAEKHGYVDRNGNSTFSEDEIKQAEAKKAQRLEEIKQKEKEEYLKDNPTWIDGEWYLDEDIYYDGLNFPVHYSERIIIDYDARTVKYISNNKVVYDGAFAFEKLRNGLTATHDISKSGSRLIAHIDHNKKLLKFSEGVYFSKGTSSASDEVQSNMESQDNLLKYEKEIADCRQRLDKVYHQFQRDRTTGRYSALNPPQSYYDLMKACSALEISASKAKSKARSLGQDDLADSYEELRQWAVGMKEMAQKTLMSL